MKYVQVRDFDPPVGGEYLATSYPGNGVYHVPRLAAYFMVANGLTASLASARGALGEVESPQVAIDVAKLLAVALHPGAAAKYLEK